MLLAGRGLFSLGSDSHAVIDMFEEARAVELGERLARRARGVIPADRLLQAATYDGHHALGWADAGVFAVGMRADFVAVQMDSMRTAGGGASVENTVFAATAADVTDVVVDGRAVVVDPEWFAKVRGSNEASILAGLPKDEHEIAGALSIPPRMVDYLLSRQGWIPRL